ncbi:MAG: FlgD immunoglobulin-like domain containing protein [bacterium]
MRIRLASVAGYPGVTAMTLAAMLVTARTNPSIVEAQTRVIETADGSVNTVGQYTSIALDASGNPHVTYQDQTPFDLKYARKSGGVWTSETADGSANLVGWYTSLALDASGNPHVSYLDNTALDLKYARKSGGVWTIETADGSAVAVGMFSSLALDASGNPHVSYQDQTTFDLKYAFIPSLFISSPQPGVMWPVGSEQTIRWSFSGGLPVGNSNVYLSLDGGNSFSWIKNSARDPGLTFRVPHTPTRFAVLRVVKSTPFTDVSMDSFFTIDAAIALNKFDAQVVDGGEALGEGGGIKLAWKTTPGPEASIRYRVERATGEPPAGGSGGGLDAEFAPIHAGALDAGDIVDSNPGAGASARYRLVAINGLGEEYVLGETQIAASLATGRALAVSPNPAPDGIARIRFRASADLPETNLSIYDTTGRLVKAVAHGAMPAGVHDAAWDGRDDSGRPVAAGTYFMRLSWGGLARATERVTVVR